MCIPIDDISLFKDYSIDTGLKLSNYHNYNQSQSKIRVFSFDMAGSDKTSVTLAFKSESLGINNDNDNCNKIISLHCTNNNTTLELPSMFFKMRANNSTQYLTSVLKLDKSSIVHATKNL